MMRLSIIGLLLIPMLVLGQVFVPNIVDWVDVGPPAGFPWTPPATLQQNTAYGIYRVSPSFNIRTRANITVATTYFVDGTNGNNGNTGADFANALLTMAAAYAKADVDRIEVRNLYAYKNLTTLSPTRSVEVIGHSNVLITADNGNLIGTWTNVMSHYEAAVSGGNFVQRVVDEKSLDNFGFPSNYTEKASIAAVDAAPASFFWTGGMLYVRTYDDRHPTNGLFLRYYDTLCFAPTADSLTFYFQNVGFKGGVRIRNATSTGGLKAYFTNCTIGGDITIAGVDEIIWQNVTSNLKAREDGLNYDLRNTIVCNALEIDCRLYGGGTTSSDQPSTGHNGCRTVSINCQYHSWAGQGIADVNTSWRWVLGGGTSNSVSGVGYYAGVSSTNWIDGARSSGNTFDLQNVSGAQTYIRSFVGTGGNSINGTLTPY